MTEGKKAIINSAHQIRRTAVDDLVEAYLEWWAAANSENDSDSNDRPTVIFTKDLFDFLTIAEFFDEAATMRKMLSAKNFHFKMDEHGYDMVKNPFAAQWKHKTFRSRMAFVEKSQPQAGRYDLINAELQRRPLAFESE
jgi:hypothetical protein